MTRSFAPVLLTRRSRQVYQEVYRAVTTATPNLMFSRLEPRASVVGEVRA
jgi:hypothetical protein